MLPMSRFDEIVMNIGYYYHQCSTNRHVEQESKYLWELKTIKYHTTFSKRTQALST